MDNQQRNDASSSPNKKSAIPVDEVIYDRNSDEADADMNQDGMATEDKQHEDDVVEEQGGSQEEPVANRRFMDEMFDNDAEFNDEDYVDMPSYDELAAENAKLKRQLASVINQYEKLKGDWASYRNRTKQEIERAKDLASERVATQIIPVIDDLNRSIEHIRTMGDEMIPLANGNEAISNRIIAALAKEGIEVISPLGEQFDVNRHQAIAMQEVEGKKPGIVFHVYQDGYAIGDRVIRPASVGVTK